MLLVQEPRLLQSHCPSEAALSAGRLLPRHGGREERAAVKEGRRGEERKEEGEGEGYGTIGCREKEGVDQWME